MNTNSMTDVTKCDFRPSGEDSCKLPVENIAINSRGEIMALVCNHHGDCLAGDDILNDWTWFTKI